MGLGLGIVKNIIDSHKGKITYQTDKKTGTTFIIELKLKKPKT
jgi:signal transduction histidine kinase